MRISGLVKAAARVREDLRRGIPPEARDEFRDRVRTLVSQVEMLCDENAASVDDLPGPSRKAYAFLRDLDLDELPEPSEEEPAPVPTARISGVVGAAERIARRLWRERDRFAREEWAREEIRETAASHAAAIEEIAKEQDSAPEALPARARRHYALLKWFAEPGTIERWVEAMVRAGEGLATAAGADPTLTMVPMSAAFRWRKRGRRISLRVSTAYLAAGPEDWELLARSLTGGADAAAAKKGARRFLASPAAVAAVREIDAMAAPPDATAGRAHDLATSFSRVNLRMFGGKLGAPNLLWSKRITGRVFGRYRKDRDEVVISQSLDDPEVPPEIVDFVVYHELLHREMGTEERNGRRRVHSPEFRRREALFPAAAAADAFLERLARRLGGA